MSTTPFLGITEMEPGQSQAHIVHNEGIRAVERAAVGYLDKTINANIVALTDEELEHSIILLSGSPVAPFEITIPTPLIRVWLIINSTPHAAVFVTSGGSTCTVLSGTVVWLTCNGNLLTMLSGGSGDITGGTGIAIWDSTVTYLPGDIVISGGTMYQCILNNINRPVTNATYWRVLIMGSGGSMTPPVILDGSDLDSDEYTLTIKGQAGVVNDTASGERAKGISLKNGHIKFDDELTLFRNVDDGFLDVQRIGADYTILRVDAPPTELGSNEATMCLMCNPNTPQFTFMDIYNEEYSEERQCGIRVQRGRNSTIPYKPFVFDFNNTTPWRHKLRCFTCYITEGIVNTEVLIRKDDPEVPNIDPIGFTSVTEIISVVGPSRTYVQGTDYILTYNWVDWRVTGGTKPALGEALTVTYKYNRANFATQGNTVINNTLTFAWNSKDSVDFPSNQPGPIYPDDATQISMYAKKVANKVTPALAEVNWREKMLQTKLAYDRFVAYLPKSGPYDGTSLGVNFTRYGPTLWHPFSIDSFYASLSRTRISSDAAANSCAGICADQPTFWRGNSNGRGGFFAVFRFGMGANWDGTSFFAGLAANAGALTTNPSNLLNMIGVGFDTTDPSTGNWYLMMNDGSGTATKIDTKCLRSNAQCLTLTLFCYPYHTIHNHWIGVTLRDENNVVDVIDSVIYSDNIPAIDALMGPQILANTGATTNAVVPDIMKIWVETDI